MSNAKITLYGFTRWMELNGKDLFGNLTLPDGIDKQLFTDNLMMEAGEFGVLYSDPELMTKMIGVWGRKHYRTFDKWVTALNKEYEPLYNLDVFEEWQDTGSSSGSKSGTSGSTTGDTLTGGYSRTDGYTKSGTNESSQTSSGSETIAEDETDTNNLHNETTGTTTTENTRSAFDSSTYQPHDKSEVTASSESDDTGTVERDRDQTTTTTGTVSGDGEFTETNAGTQTDTHNESRTITSSGTTGESTEGESASEHSGHRYGNQGVTMSQQMLQAELDVQRWNIYEHMTDLFIQDFCIAVYI